MPRAPTWSVLTGPGRFGAYLVGALLSNLGTWAQNLAAVIAVYRITGSTVMVALVTVVQFIAPVVLVSWSGRVTDRYSRRLVIVVTQLVGALASVALAGFAVADRLTTPVLLLAMFVLGICQTFQAPAQLALVPLLVAPEQRDVALSLNSAQFNLARAVGPVLAALLLETTGFAVVFAVNALSYVAIVAAVAITRPRGTQEPFDSSAPGISSCH
jgi:MFS family permease